MKLEEVLQALAVFGNDQPVPRQALAEAARQREEITPILLDVLDQIYEKARLEGEAVYEDENYDLFYYGIFLLAQFREQRAFPKLIRLLTLDADTVEVLFGDALTESMPHILYSTYNGDYDTLRGVLVDKTKDPFVRDAVLRVLSGLIRDGQITQAEVSKLLREQLADLGDSENEVLFGAMLVKQVADCQLYDLVEDVREAYRQEKIELQFMGNFSEFFDDLYGKSRGSDLARLIEDTAQELQSWACFQTDKDKKPSTDELLSWNVGRNDPCPCGSGKKFKKCCLPKQEALKLELSQGLWEVNWDRYPPIDRQEDQPGLSDFYSRDAIKVDHLVYQALCMLNHPTRQQKMEKRKTRAEAKKLLWRAFEAFQRICQEEQLATPTAYDQHYKLHYLCRSWLEGLRDLLEQEKGAQYDAVQAVLDSES